SGHCSRSSSSARTSALCLERQPHHVPQLDRNGEPSKRHTQRCRLVAIRTAEREIPQSIRDVVHSVRSAEIVIAKQVEPVLRQETNEIGTGKEIQMLNRIQVVPSLAQQPRGHRSGVRRREKEPSARSKMSAKLIDSTDGVFE